MAQTLQHPSPDKLKRGVICWHECNQHIACVVCPLLDLQMTQMMAQSQRNGFVTSTTTIESNPDYHVVGRNGKRKGMATYISNEAHKLYSIIDV